MKDIYIFTIPHKKQAYSTVGSYADFNYKGKCSVITVSKMSDWRYEALVAVHELVEYILVKYWKISIESTDNFDIEYEQKRLFCFDDDFLNKQKREHKGQKIWISNKCGCEITKTSEPGDDKHAPYYSAHQVATKIERLLAVVLQVKWSAYEKAVNNL